MLNFFVKQKKCCGADGSWDYYMSDWWIAENEGVSPSYQTSHIESTYFKENRAYETPVNLVVYINEDVISNIYLGR